MKLVGDFLSRFQSLKPPDDSVKTAIVSALKESLDITCSKNNISISHGVAYIKLSSVAKNVIQVNRSRVLGNLFEKLPRAKEIVRDIR